LDVEGVEEVWHGLSPPFTELFEWGEGRAAAPIVTDIPVFRPFMLAHPIEDTKVSLDDYAAEWKWDGIRVQLVHAGGDTRLYSRTGDDISGSFPDVAAAFAARGVLDGE
jgi:DNA ligase-1